jgi:hypothetical protein
MRIIGSRFCLFVAGVILVAGAQHARPERRAAARDCGRRSPRRSQNKRRFVEGAAGLGGDRSIVAFLRLKRGLDVL